MVVARGGRGLGICIVSWTDSEQQLDFDAVLFPGNVKSINLSGNKIETLSGFSKLYSLEYLDVSNNEVSQVPKPPQ